MVLIRKGFKGLYFIASIPGQNGCLSKLTGASQERHFGWYCMKIKMPHNSLIIINPMPILTDSKPCCKWKVKYRLRGVNT